MKAIVCPMSSDTIDKRVARVGATLTAGLLAAYALTGLRPILAVVVLDYVMRVFTPFRTPFGLVGSGIVSMMRGEPARMNKGPKIFAWRIGFLMAVVSLGLLFVSPQASVIVAVALAGFNILDGVLNFCVGCVLYSYVVLPMFGSEST